MKTLLVCLVVVLCAASALAHPGSRDRRYAAPARTMMFSGYFRGQHYPHGGGGFRHYVPRNYEPEGAMTAFAAGNTVSAGSYYGNGGVAPATPECGQCNGNGNGHGNGHGNGNGNGHGYGNGNALPAGDEPAPSPPEVIPVNGADEVPEELPAADAPAYPGDEPEEALIPEQPATEAPSFDAEDPQEPEDAPAPPSVNGNGNGKKNGNGNGNGKKNGNGHSNDNGNGKGNGNGGKTRPRADDDYSDEEDDAPSVPLFPGKRGRGRGNFYNTYFPMVFGGYPGRSGAAGGETPGVATAIANSFSQGRGAVATSHATAYGGPHLLGPNGSRKAASRRPSASA